MEGGAKARFYQGLELLSTLVEFESTSARTAAGLERRSVRRRAVNAPPEDLLRDERGRSELLLEVTEREGLNSKKRRELAAGRRRSLRKKRKKEGR